jgi:hypothetical protein
VDVAGRQQVYSCKEAVRRIVVDFQNLDAEALQGLGAGKAESCLWCHA